MKLYKNVFINLNFDVIIDDLENKLIVNCDDLENIVSEENMNKDINKDEN